MAHTVVIQVPAGLEKFSVQERLLWWSYQFYENGSYALAETLKEACHELKFQEWQLAKDQT